MDCQAVDFTVDSFGCNGDFTIQSLTFKCSQDECDFGTGSLLVSGKVTVENDFTEPVQVDVNAYIQGIITSNVYYGEVYPCDVLEASSYYGSTCPEAGQYNFTTSYELPESGSSVWWTTGQISLAATLKDGAGSKSTCDFSLSVSNVSGSGQSYNYGYSMWSLSGLSIVILAVLAYSGKKRVCVTLSDMVLEDQAIDDDLTNHSTNVARFEKMEDVA